MKIFAWAILAFISTQAFAQNKLPKDLKNEIAKCAKSETALKRLACFDGITERLSIEIPKEGQIAGGSKGNGRQEDRNSNWRVQEKTSLIDDSHNVHLYLSASSEISGWPRKIEIPSINLRCKENTTEAYIHTGMSPQIEYDSDDATITLRFDKEKAVKYKTGKSTDGEALFFHQPIPFIKKLMNHSSLLFEFTPFNSSPTMTTFPLSGLADAIKPLRQACKW